MNTVNNSPRNKHHLQSCLAYSIIEFAITLPIILGLVAATFEVNRFLQVRAAAQAALQESLRCIYPVDGSCNQSYSNPNAITYNWFKSCGPVSCLYPTRDFAGEARYLKLPKYTFNYEARVPDRVFVDFPYQTYTARQYLYEWPTKQEGHFWLEKGFLPKISGSDLRNPSFTYRSGGETYTDSYELYVTTTNSRRLKRNFPSGNSYEITPVKIRIPLPTVQADCYQTATINGNFRESRDFVATQHDHIKAGCRIDPNGNKTRIAFHLRGRSDETDPLACAKVRLFLRKVDEPLESLDLGGQVYQGPRSSQNYYPRGIPCEPSGNPRRCESPYIGEESWRNVPELLEHNVVTVEYNTEYEILLSIFEDNTILPNCTTGRLHWEYSGISMFVPDHRYHSINNLSCLPGVRTVENVEPSSVPNNFVCSHNQQITNDDFYINSVQLFTNRSNALQQPQIVTPSTSQYVLHHEFPVSGRFYGAADPALSASIPAGYQAEVSGSGVLTHEASCPAMTHSVSYPGGTTQPNFGVSETPNSQNLIFGAAEASPICPAELSLDYRDALARGGTPLSMRWSLSNWQPVQGVTDYWTKSTCIDTPPNMPAQSALLSRFPSPALRWDPNNPIRVPGQFQAFNTGAGSCGAIENDPADPVLIKQEPQFSCPEIELATVRYQGGLPGIPSNSLFADTHPNLDDPSCHTCSMLREEAEGLSDLNLRLPENRFFLSDVSAAFEQVLDCPPALSFSNQNCVVYRMQGEQDQGRYEPVSGGPYPADFIPSECGSNCSCRREPVFNGMIGGDLFDKQLAEQRGRALMEATVPWIKFDCDDQGCADISIEEFKNSNPNARPNDIHFIASASVNVPFTLLPGLSLPVSVQAKESWEGKFAR